MRELPPVLEGFRVHEATRTVEWYTPPRIFDALDLRYDVDVASPPGGLDWIPADRFVTPAENGLMVAWEGRVWCNPPYGRDIERWTRRMIGHDNGVLLVFARTDTAWWQDAASAAGAVCYVRGRIAFIPGGYHRAGKRTPTDRPGASNTLMGFGPVCAKAVADCGLGLVQSCKWELPREEAAKE